MQTLVFMWTFIKTDENIFLNQWEEVCDEQKLG